MGHVRAGYRVSIRYLEPYIEEIEVEQAEINEFDYYD